MSNKLFANMLLVLLSIFFCVLLIEGGLRILKPQASTTQFVDCIIKPDPDLKYRFQENATGRVLQMFEIDNIVYTNKLGFHDVTHPARNKDTIIVMAIGDSFTSAMQVPIEKGWTQTAQQALQPLPVQIYNFGIDGSGTTTHLAIIQKYLPVIQPDIIVLAFYENDINDIANQVTLGCYDNHLLIYQTEQQRTALIKYLEENKPSAFSYWLAEHFFFYRTIAPILHKPSILLRSNSLSPGIIDMPLEAPNPNAVQLFENAITEMQALTQTASIPLLIIPVPGKENPMQSYQTLINNLPSPENFTILDPYTRLQELAQVNNLTWKALYFQNDGHFNETGYYLFGETVAELILPYVEK